MHLVICWALLAPGLAHAQTPDGGRAVVIEPVQRAAPAGNAGLFVGVNEFSHDPQLTPLRYAVNDALAQAHLFVIELKLLEPEHTFVLLSGQATTAASRGYQVALERVGVAIEQADRANTFRRLTQVHERARHRENLIVVFFSSHGFEDAGSPFVMPRDGITGLPADTAVNLKSVEQMLSNSQAGKRLLLVDACRTRAVQGARDITGHVTRAFRDALAQAEGQAVLMSADVGQFAFENDALGHGVFTYHMLRAMRGGAQADEQGFITLGSVIDHVSREVPAWIIRHHAGVNRDRAQRPWFKGPNDARLIPLAVDPDRRRQHVQEQSQSRALLERRLATLRRLYIEGKLTIEHHREASGYLTDKPGELDATREARRKEIFRVLDGELKPESLDRALALHSLESRAERQTRLARAEAEKQVLIADVLRRAQAAEQTENWQTAQRLAGELLVLDPTHREGAALRDRIRRRLVPDPFDFSHRDRTAAEAQAAQRDWAAHHGVEVETTNSIDMRLCFIPPGEYLRGSPANEAGRQDIERQHYVRLTNGFWIGSTEVTQRQWERLMGNNPSQRRRGGDHPVASVTWNLAVEFCRKLTEMERRAGRIGPDHAYRLPTEAEWEYACRAGTTTAYHSGDGLTALKQAGWATYAGRWGSAGSAKEVSSFVANPWGLYDMHGNVAEWCSDWFESEYPAGPVDNPAGPATGSERVLRGGSWHDGPARCRSAYRSRSAPNHRFYHIGFRVALSVVVSR